MVISMSRNVPREEGRKEKDRLTEYEAVYEKELAAYSCIEKGDCELVREAFEELIKEKTSLGGLNTKSIDEAKYRSAEIINIAARYAARRISREDRCLALADRCVCEIDKATDRDEIYRLLIERAAQLALLVHSEGESGDYPYVIRKAIRYINSSLEQNIGVCDVARECNISPDYLSFCFKKATGVRMTAYIRRRKLLLAKDILGQHIRCNDAAKRLSFCSESYFVKCFKDEFGVTPKKWQNTC